ncbi:hypothetical protein DENSPDRAFT_868138 [Dentipellis sp. KUC8613]|nr:hypothetical protein DENSPDRAFT_868138 [Dentipellis sp. KUC8613]
MDIYASATAAWLQQQQQQQQHQQQQPSQQPIHNDPHASLQRPLSSDWKDPSSSSSATTTPTPSATPIDLSDFGLGDLSAPSSSALANPSFFPFTNQFYLPNLSSPYNAMSYVNGSWPNSQGSVPLSNYSTLNGATTSNAPSQQQQQPAQQAVIDPALTTINNSSSQSYSPPNIPSHSPPLSSQQSLSQYPYSHLQPSNLSIPYSISYQPTQQQQQQQQQSQQQQQQHQQQQQQYQSSFSPYALQSPTPPAMTISPTTFYGTNPQTPAAPSAAAVAQAQARRKQFLAGLATQLGSANFTGGAGRVRDLVTLIADYGITEVDAATRQEILTKVRDTSTHQYFRAWSENNTALEIMREWLKTAVASDDNPYIENIMPILHIADRLPFTYQTLANSKLGKIIRKLVKDATLPAVKDMASQLEKKWRDMFLPVEPMHVDEDSQDGKRRKRKSSDPPPKAAPPAKKAALAPASSSKPGAVKREIKPVPAAAKVKDSKSDSSFFSAPKPKPKLPSFKKSPAPPVKKEPDPNVAQPSSINPFQEALKDMAKARKASPVVVPTPPPPRASGSTPPLSAGLTKTGKKRKTVTWAADGQLEQVKFIDRAVYDDDPVDGMHTSHNLRDLDRDEGAALHAHLFEELIDWSEPLSLAFPPDAEPRPRGEDSQEKVTQEQREQTALGALYLAQIPDTPGEPAAQLPPEQVDEHVRLMLTGPEVDALFWQQQPAEQPGAAPVSVSDLVGQLAAPAAAVPDPAALLAQVASLGNVNIPPEQLQQLASMFAQQQPFGAGLGVAGAVPPAGPSDGMYDAEQQQQQQQQQHGWGDASYADGPGRERRWGEGSQGWRGGKASMRLFIPLCGGGD